MQKKLRILMLGWEFPPVLTGGLGKACYGISKALSEHVDLTLVLPKTHPEHLANRFGVIGLNQHFSQQTLPSFIQAPEQDYLHEAHCLDIPLDPYSLDHLLTSFPALNFDEFFTSLSAVASLAQKQALFEAADNYGSDILSKIAVYTEAVTQLAQDAPFDIIHAHDWMTFPAALHIQRESDKPLVLHIHSLETDRLGIEKLEPEKNLAYQIEHAAMQQADAVITVSEYTRDQLTEHYQLATQAVTPVHNGIDADDAKDFKQAHPFTYKIAQKLVMWIGRVTQQKGPQSFIDTAEMLTKADPTVNFVVAGTGDQLPWLIEETARRRLSDKIYFTGFLQEGELMSLLSQADAFFMPSTSEPFGLAALEAARMGVPCVISRQSGVAEVLTASLQADYWDVNKLANYLYAAIHYEGLRKELIQASKQQLSSLSWEKSAQRIKDIYDQITTNHEQKPPVPIV